MIHTLGVLFILYSIAYYFYLSGQYSKNESNLYGLLIDYWESERNIQKLEKYININLDKFKSYTKGFLDGAGDALTKHEIETLPLGAITMTVECGARFLTDYLNGDKYFKIDYPKHNLDRAKCQLALAQDMIRKSSQMQEIVDSCSKNAKQKENGEN